MNLSVDFTRDPAFVAFKKDVNHQSALEFIFNMGAKCQSGKTTKLRLPADYVGATLGLPDQIDPNAAMASLIKHRMIEAIPDEQDTFLINVFVDHNSRLISCWRSGARGGRPKEKPVPAPLAAPSPKAAPAVRENLDVDVPF